MQLVAVVGTACFPVQVGLIVVVAICVFRQVLFVFVQRVVVVITTVRVECALLLVFEEVKVLRFQQRSLVLPVVFWVWVSPLVWARFVLGRALVVLVAPIGPVGPVWRVSPVFLEEWEFPYVRDIRLRLAVVHVAILLAFHYVQKSKVASLRSASRR